MGICRPIPSSPFPSRSRTSLPHVAPNHLLVLTAPPVSRPQGWASGNNLANHNTPTLSLLWWSQRWATGVLFWALLYEHTEDLSSKVASTKKHEKLNPTDWVIWEKSWAESYRVKDSHRKHLTPAMIEVRSWSLPLKFSVQLLSSNKDSPLMLILV